MHQAGVIEKRDTSVSCCGKCTLCVCVCVVLVVVSGVQVNLFGTDRCLWRQNVNDELYCTQKDYETNSE